MSCSQPLQAGDVYGSLTLVAMDGQRAGTTVNYFAEVFNAGAPITGLSLTDDNATPGMVGDDITPTYMEVIGNGDNVLDTERPGPTSTPQYCCKTPIRR